MILFKKIVHTIPILMIYFPFSLIGSIIHHTQSSVVTPTQTTIQNPMLNRVAAPPNRQSLHINTTNSSLSHVVIQQRQIVPIPPQTIQHKPSTTNVSSNRTSTVVVPPASKPSEIEQEHTEIETPIVPSTLVSTQMPQTPKQIVFETKIQPKNDTKEDKQQKSVETPVKIEKSIENNKQDDVPSATTSVIKSILSKPEDVKPKTEESTSSSVKEDSEYWSAKEVNIESVIKEVDALCTTDEETNIESKVIVKTESPKAEIVDDTEKCDAKSEASKMDKNQSKREKILRSKKTSQTELENQRSPPPSVLATTEQQAGVQTRRSVTKPTVQTKRGRGARNASPRSGKTGVVVGNDNKPRNNNSESDIYEFHEDSGEETIVMQSNEPPRARALSISKPHTITQPSSPNTQSIEPTKPAQLTVVTAPEPEPKPVQSPEVEKSSESHDESKDDPANLNNVRKSRRLIERDVSRSTVDDVIEDVVKNMSKEQTVITSSATIVQPQSTSTQAQPRRSTRHSTNLTPVKLNVNEKVDLRKSPRPLRGTKEMKTSEFEAVVDDKSEESQRADVHDEKRCDDSEATQSASESGETRIEPPKPEPIVVEVPKVHTVVKELPNVEVENRKLSSVEPMKLIDPVTGMLTVVHQSNEGQYVPVSTHSGEFMNKPSVLVTSREVRSVVETTSTIVSKVSTAPIVTIVSKPVPISVPMPMPIPIPMPIPTTAPVHVQKSTVVITSKAVEPPTHGVPLSMSIEKTLAQPSPQPQIQIQPIVHTQTQSQVPPHHSLKAHVLGSQHVKVSQAPVITTPSAGTPVILSTSVSNISHVSNVQPVIKSTIIQSSVAQPNIPTHKYGKESPGTSVIAQQPQYQPKIQVSVAQQQPQSMPHMQTAHKNTLIVNIPTSISANPPSAHSPRHSPNVSAKVTHAHEPQYSIHVPKHSVANIHQPQILSQKPVVIHSNKIHMPPTSTNYTSVVQCSGKVIQTQASHHMQQPSPLVQMGPAQPMQHISQSQQQPQQTKSSTGHQISIQSTQSSPFVSSVPIQVRTSASKYETAPSQKFKQHIMPPNIQQIQSQPASIVQQQQQSVAKQSTFPPQTMPPSNQIRLHQASQIMTGAVASPPPKQPHLSSQQPIVAGKQLLLKLLLKL